MIPFFLLPGIRKVEASNKLRFLVNVSAAGATVRGSQVGISLVKPRGQ